jgi:hypothetical protein
MSDGLIGWRGKWRVVYEDDQRSRPMSLDAAMSYMEVFKAKAVTDGKHTYNRDNPPGLLRLFWERIIW